MRIGERVSEEHLEQRARQREEPAAGEGGERPGRAHAPEDFARDLVAAAEQRVGELRGPRSTLPNAIASARLAGTSATTRMGTVFTRD